MLGTRSYPAVVVVALSTTPLTMMKLLAIASAIMVDVMAKHSTYSASRSASVGRMRHRKLRNIALTNKFKRKYKNKNKTAYAKKCRPRAVTSGK